MALVAVVGRPNVGKSTLVNRIIGRREAIVAEAPGVTRDRKYLSADWAGRRFTLIDTGGLDFGIKADLSRRVRAEALFAIREADVVIFLVDGVSGIVSPDDEIADVLRKHGKPTLVAVNKLDEPTRPLELEVFHKLGLGEPRAISALHGIGTGDLLDEVVKLLPEEEEEEKEAEEGQALPVAIVGRPNVGKSSVFNRLLGQERAIVSELPGTTRDAIDHLIALGGENYLFVDTAGLRKKARVATAVEYYSALRVRQAIRRAQLVLLVIDAQEGVTDQDQKVASEIARTGKAAIVLLNKWDLLSEKQAEPALIQAREALRFIDFAPILSVSALTGRGMERVFPTIKKVRGEYFRRVQTSKVNEFVQAEGPSLETSVRGKPLKLYYATQVKVAPPTFVLFVNLPGAGRLVPPSYLRFLERKLSQAFDFEVTPIRIRFREKRSGNSR